MNLNQNKKGIELLNFPIWVLRIMFLTILIISMGFMVSKYLNLRVDITPLESQIMLQRLTSSNALMHQDKSTQQTIFAVLDSAKLPNADTKLAEEFNFGEGVRHISAKISIDSRKTPNYVNKRLFEDLAPLLSGIFKSDVQEAKQAYATFTYENEKFKQDKLTIQVLQQK